MADISKITLPSGSTYNLKDEVARQIASGAVYLCGTTSTTLADQATTSSVIIPEAREIRGVEYAAGASYAPVSGDAFFQNSKEFVWDGAHWNEFGDMSGLGALAYKDAGSVTFTPTGSVSTPDILVSAAGSTGTINEAAAKTVVTDMSVAAPSSTTATGELVYCSVSNNTLTLSKFVETTGTSITTTSKTFKTGDASYYATQPTFSGDSQTTSVTFTS